MDKIQIIDDQEVIFNIPEYNWQGISKTLLNGRLGSRVRKMDESQDRDLRNNLLEKMQSKLGRARNTKVMPSGAITKYLTYPKNVEIATVTLCSATGKSVRLIEVLEADFPELKLVYTSSLIFVERFSGISPVSTSLFSWDAHHHDTSDVMDPNSRGQPLNEFLFNECGFFETGPQNQNIFKGPLWTDSMIRGSELILSNDSWLIS